MARDRRGASILLALFLMLVCMAVGVVILSAGVAAGGRKSRIADMDRRFFSVDSAASIFRELIEEQSVTVVREKETVKTTVYPITVKDDDTKIRGEGKSTTSDPTYDAYFSSTAGTKTTALGNAAEISFLAEITKDLLGNSLDAADVYMLENLPNMTEAKTHTYQLSHDTSAAGVDKTLLTVDAVIFIDVNGDMTVTLTSKDADSKDAYSVKMLFGLSLDSRSSKNVETDTPRISGSGTSYKETIDKTTTETKTDTFTWVFESMDVIRK